MPKVLYFADPSNRMPGRGATVRLDSGEPCVISFARTGVRVKKSRYGFFGPVLYHEKDLYKVARTSLALSALYPENLLPAGFTEPNLKAFTNAILHCSDATRVCIVLNEAISRATEDGLMPGYV